MRQQVGSSRRPTGDRAESGRSGVPATDTARSIGERAAGSTAAPGGGWDLPTLQRTIGNRALGDLLAARDHGAGCGDGCGHGGEQADSLVGAALRGTGRPLEAPFQREMESAFQSDLSGVREFRGAAAERAAAAVDAKAFTIGDSIVYGAGADSKETRIHELTHVVKPISVAGSSVGGVGVTDPNGAGEREAEANAQRIVSGGASMVTGSGGAQQNAVAQRALSPATHGSAMGFFRTAGVGNRTDAAWMLTDGSLVGSKPSGSPPGWDYIQNLKLTNFWIRFHLINEIAGGPGTAPNLVPASKTDNSQYHSTHETALKKDVQAARANGKDSVFYGVELDYATPAAGTVDQQNNAPFFPTSLSVYHHYYSDATKTWTVRHNGTPFNFSQPQPTDPGTVTPLATVDVSALKTLAPAYQKWDTDDVTFLHDIASGGARNTEFTAVLNELAATVQPADAVRQAFDTVPFRKSTSARAAAKGTSFGQRVSANNGDRGLEQLSAKIASGRITL